jgi:hypothetical protein
MRLTEVQNKYRAAKKTACWYELWADGKERHIQQEWERIVVGLQNVLLVMQGKAQAALTDNAVPDRAVTDSAVSDSAVTDSAVIKQLDEQIQSLQDAMLQYTPS